MALHPVMLVIAIAVYSAPVVLAVLVDRQIRAFQKEAFGHLAKAARNLRMMAWFILLFFLGVVVGGLAVGDLKETAMWPISGTAATMYLRVFAATAGYLFALAVSKELYAVTKPQKARRKD